MAARKLAKQLTAILPMVCPALLLAATYTSAAPRRWLRPEGHSLDVRQGPIREPAHDLSEVGTADEIAVAPF